MSHRHSSVIVRDALVSSHTQPHDGSAKSKTRDPNSFAAVNEDCGGGLLAPLLAAIIPGSVMYLATVSVIHNSAADWSMPTPNKAMLIASVLIGLIPIAFFTYRITIGIGALFSSAAFLTVAIFLPMEQSMRWLYGVGIVLSLAASSWASGVQPLSASPWVSELRS